MLFFRTVSFLYLRYCIIVLSALSSFMVGFDVMNTSSELPASANLLLLYLVYKFLYAIGMMLPIALVFAFIASIIELIRSNALVAYSALGYSKLRILTPFLGVAATFIVIYIGAHTTSFARANEYAENLRESSEFLRPNSDLFFTHEGNYIYFGKLNPLTQSAQNIRLFTFENGILVDTLSAAEAYYQDSYWIIPKARVIHAPKTVSLNEKGIVVEEVENRRVLHNFRPKILDQVYEGKVNYTLPDALDALKLLKHQNIDLSKVTSSLYHTLVTPWFSLILIVIIYTYAPMGARFVNLSLFSFGAILSTLFIWGFLFTGGELSNSKTLSPEVGILLPIGLLLLMMSVRLSRFKIKSRLNISSKVHR